MSNVTTILVLLALLGSALIGGVFFAFSSFIMKALARVPSPEGIAAMQSINVVVINPLFLGAFIGTALLSIGLAAFSLPNLDQVSTALFFSGAVMYFAGTFFVTMFRNVPLNNRLAAISVMDADAVKLWVDYLGRWTMWNHVRTATSISATLLFAIGLMER